MPAAFSEDIAADDSADEPEFASYEVGAGLGDAKPFLRATLADEKTDGGEEPDADEPRELRVYDKLARLDAGLPPLPPGDYPNEVLMPPPRRPAPAAKPAVAVAPIEKPVEIEREVVLKALESDDEPPRSVPAPDLFRPLVEEDRAEGDAPEPPAPTLRRDPAPEPKSAGPARRSIFRSFLG